MNEAGRGRGRRHRRGGLEVRGRAGREGRVTHRAATTHGARRDMRAAGAVGARDTDGGETGRDDGRDPGRPSSATQRWQVQKYCAGRRGEFSGLFFFSLSVPSHVTHGDAPLDPFATPNDPTRCSSSSSRSSAPSSRRRCTRRPAVPRDTSERACRGVGLFRNECRERRGIPSTRRRVPSARARHPRGEGEPTAAEDDSATQELGVRRLRAARRSRTSPTRRARRGARDPSAMAARKAEVISTPR